MANMYFDDEPPTYLYAATLLAAERLSQKDREIDEGQGEKLNAQLTQDARATQERIAEELSLDPHEEVSTASHEEMLYAFTHQISRSTTEAARIAQPERASEIPELLLSLDEEQRSFAESLGEEFAHNTASAAYAITVEEPHTLLLNTLAFATLQQWAETTYGFDQQRVRSWLLRCAAFALHCAPAAASNAFSVAWNTTSLKEAGEVFQQEHGDVFSEEQHEALHEAANDEAHPLRQALEGDLQLSYHREVISRLPSLLADATDTSEDAASHPLSLYVPPPKITMRPSENLPHADALTRGMLAHFGVHRVMDALLSHKTQISPDETQKLMTGEAHTALDMWRERNPAS